MMGHMLFPLISKPSSPVSRGDEGSLHTFNTTGNNTTHAAVRGT
jgi:hypothetical protein